MNPTRWPLARSSPGSRTAMKALIGILIATPLGSGYAKQDWIDRTLVTADVTGIWAGEFFAGPHSAPRASVAQPDRIAMYLSLCSRFREFRP